MRLEGESYGIDVGSFVMSLHHGLLRMGVVESKRRDDQGWTRFTVNFFEDDIHKARVEWDKELNSKTVHTNEFRSEYLKPVSVQWLKMSWMPMGDIKMSDEQKTVEEVTDDLIPKPPSKLAPRGITSFTVFRQQDETGVSGEGVVIEGVVMATGQCVVHWLYPPPRGGIAIFDSMSDFVKVHIEPHPANQTIITYQDGHKDVYGGKPEEDKQEEEK